MHRYLIQIAIIILVSYANTQGQTSELKYKDIHPTLQDMPNNEAFDILQKFQKQDPYHANAYYQLGIAAYNLAKTFDPLTDYNNLSYFTYHANLYYGLAHKYLDEKEAKKNKVKLMDFTNNAYATFYIWDHSKKDIISCKEKGDL